MEDDVNEGSFKIGLALSGGGARGIAHLGVIKALEEMGVAIHHLSGTSFGAMMATLYAYGLPPDRILDLIINTRFFSSLRPAWTLKGLINLERLSDILLKIIPENNFSCLKTPVTVTATNLSKGTVEYFDSGELIPAVLASCCVPVVFNPMILNGHVYVDGGIMDNLPTRPLRDKCDILIASNCNNVSSDFDVRNFRSVVERSLLMAINGNTTISKNISDVVIEPPGLGSISVFDVGKAVEVFERAYEFTKTNFSPFDFQKNRF